MKITDKKLWELCQKYGGEARRWKRKFAALLPEVERRELWKEHDFYSIYHFAKIVGGLSENTVQEVLSLDKKLEDKPLLKEQIAEQGWAKVRVAARIPVIEEKAVEIVKTLSKSAIETYAREFDISTETPKARPGSELQAVTFKLDDETHFQLKKFQQKLEKKRKKPVPLGIALKELLKLAPKEPPKQTRKSSKAKTIQVSAKQKRDLEQEFRGKCAIEPCKNPSIELHHTKRFAKHHTHEGVVPLCHEHHQLAHAGLIANEQDPPGQWRFRKQMLPNSIDKKHLKQLSLTHT